MAHSLPEVFVRKGHAVDIEEWDDTALIEAYDRAMGNIKEKLSKKKVPVKPVYNLGKKNKKPKPKWKVGDFCQALYSVDELVYEAEILEINEEEGKCIVQFVGYENEEEVDLDSISPSQGKSVRVQQLETAKNFAEHKWEVGDLCFALYSKDGMYYDAAILEVYPDYCVVKFIGYDNEEEVDLDNIFVLPSVIGSPTANAKNCASNARDKSHGSLDESSSTFSSDMSSVSTRAESGGSTFHSRSVPRDIHGQRGGSRRHHHHRHHSSNFPSHSSVPDFMLPSASMPVPVNIEMQDELGPMLMAWYMAGFHTGYYQGRSSRLMPGSYPQQSQP